MSRHFPLALLLLTTGVTSDADWVFKYPYNQDGTCECKKGLPSPNGYDSEQACLEAFAESDLEYCRYNGQGINEDNCDSAVSVAEGLTNGDCASKCTSVVTDLLDLSEYESMCKFEVYKVFEDGDGVAVNAASCFSTRAYGWADYDPSNVNQIPPLRVFHDVQSPAKCQELCQSLPACALFSYRAVADVVTSSGGYQSPPQTCLLFDTDYVNAVLSTVISDLPQPNPHCDVTKVAACAQKPWELPIWAPFSLSADCLVCDCEPRCVFNTATHITGPAFCTPESFEGCHIERPSWTSTMPPCISEEIPPTAAPPALNTDALTSTFHAPDSSVTSPEVPPLTAPVTPAGTPELPAEATTPQQGATTGEVPSEVAPQDSTAPTAHTPEVIPPMTATGTSIPPMTVVVPPLTPVGSAATALPPTSTNPQATLLPPATATDIVDSPPLTAVIPPPLTATIPGATLTPPASAPGSIVPPVTDTPMTATGPGEADTPGSVPGATASLPATGPLVPPMTATIPPATLIPPMTATGPLVPPMTNTVPPATLIPPMTATGPLVPPMTATIPPATLIPPMTATGPLVPLMTATIPPATLTPPMTATGPLVPPMTATIPPATLIPPVSATGPGTAVPPAITETGPGVSGPVETTLPIIGATTGELPTELPPYESTPPTATLLPPATGDLTVTGLESSPGTEGLPLTSTAPVAGSDATATAVPPPPATGVPPGCIGQACEGECEPFWDVDDCMDC